MDILDLSLELEILNTCYIRLLLDIKMSAYAHQMEREFSAQSLSSQGNSELGSRYAIESGFYMTSFTATIFIASLLTVGVLLVTLVVTLVIMLQSCESKTHGVFEIEGLSYADYDYCKRFAQHAELNSLEADEFPTACKSYASKYVKKGDYMKDLNFSLHMIESYFDRMTPKDDGKDVVLMDIDDIFPSDAPFTGRLMNQFNEDRCNGCIDYAQDMKLPLTLQLYWKLQSQGWSWILITRKPNMQYNAIVKHLKSIGYTDWSSLIMRSDNETQMDGHEYFSRKMEVMQRDCLRIRGVISSRMDGLRAATWGTRTFKLPTSSYYLYKNHFESHR